KLEDAQKVQLQTTLKEKAETECFCFKARPLPSFYNERERPKSPLNKVTNVISKKPMATPSKVFFVDYVVVTSLYDFAYVNLALQATNGVNKTSETPSVKRRMERPIYPSAVGSKTPGQKWQIFSAMQKLEEAKKVQLQTTLKEKPETELRRLRQSFCFKARPLPSFYNERERPKSPLKKVCLDSKTQKEP
ncbi:WVD2-like protein 7, partial [Tanacetum coccineum]